MAISTNKLPLRAAAFGLVFALPIGCVVEIDAPPAIEPPELDAALSSCLRGIADLTGREDVKSCVYIDQLPCTLEGSIATACPPSGRCDLQQLTPSNSSCVEATTGGLVFDNPENLGLRVPVTLALVHGEEVCPSQATACDSGSSIPGRTDGGCFARGDFELELDEQGRLAPDGDRGNLFLGSLFSSELSLESLDLTAACEGVDLSDAPDPVAARTVSITQSGRGVGQVTSGDPAVQCPPKARDESSECAASVPEGVNLVLNATPGDQSEFSDSDWSGCDSIVEGRCIVRTSTAVTARFALARRRLTVVVDSGGATGPQITADILDVDGRRIDCFDGAGECVADFAAGDTVVLTAMDQGGVLFAGWGDECQATGTNVQCTVVMTRDLVVSANYVRATTVELSWNGPGRVIPDIAGFDCPAQSPCTFALPTGDTLKLDASPEGDGAGLIRWVGIDCGSDEECTFEITGDRVAVEARFGWELFLGILGPAPALPLQGNLISVPSGIQVDFVDFSGTTEAFFEPDSQVTLTVNPGTNTNLAAWGADCAPFGDALQCTLTMNSRKRARFQVCDCEPISVTLDGSGEITSTPADLLGTACRREGCTDADRCKLWFNRGETVTLQATPSARGRGWQFNTGWSGAGCSGACDCTVVMTDATEVTAGFDYPVSFQQDIFEGILLETGLNCVFCHNPNPPPFGREAAETGLLYSQTATAVRHLIVEEPAQGACAQALGEPKRINEETIENSIMLRYPLPEFDENNEPQNGCPDHGLQNGFVSTDDARYRAMFDWIAGGCPSN